MRRGLQPTTMSDLGAAEYLGHQLLTHHQERRGLVPKTVFHKLWCISDRHLEKNYGVDSGLPRYWYKYGEMADEQSINGEFYVGPSAPWGGQAYKPVWDLTPSDFDIPDQVRGLIDRTVKWTLTRFANRKTRYLESYQYQTYSPNDFIRAYSDLRDHLQHMNLSTQEVLTSQSIRPDFDAETNEDLVIAYLDEMVITYPETDADFADLHPLFLRWDDTARMFLEQTDGFEALDTFLDKFIETLSKAVLMLKYNNHIPDEQLAQWEGSAEEAISTFESDLDRQRLELLDNREMSGVLDGVADTYDETVLSEINK